MTTGSEGHAATSGAERRSDPRGGTQRDPARPRRHGPLAGVRVIDMTRVLAGPLCAMILADLGAEVTKVEEIAKGDETRYIAPIVGGESHYFLSINRSKRSIAIDLKEEAGRQVFLELVRQADVVLENFRVGVMDRLGLGRQALRAVRPGLVVCSISGYGQTGSLSGKPSFDLVAQALSGIMSVNGEADGPPCKMGIPLGDIGGGMWAAMGILSALRHRDLTGEGLDVDISLLEGLMAQLGYVAQLPLVGEPAPKRVGSHHQNVVPYGHYRVADGDIVVAPHAGSFWVKLCHALGRPDLVTDPRFVDGASRVRNRVALNDILSGIFAGNTVAHWMSVLEAHDVPAAPINDVAQALQMPILRERGFVRSFEHPTAGHVEVLGSPIRLTRADGQRLEGEIEPTPLLGEHTVELMREAGIDDATIDRLLRDGVVRTAPPRT